MENKNWWDAELGKLINVALPGMAIKVVAGTLVVGFVRTVK